MVINLSTARSKSFTSIEPLPVLLNSMVKLCSPELTLKVIGFVPVDPSSPIVSTVLSFSSNISTLSTLNLIHTSLAPSPVNFFIFMEVNKVKFVSGLEVLKNLCSEIT